MSHAPHAPSSAGRRRQCPGSRALEATEPDDDSPESREGTAAHEVLATTLTTGELLPVGSTTSNGETVSDEMVDGAILAAQFIAALGTPIRWASEQPVSIARVHADCWGTPDFWGLYADNNLHIVDYKFGFGYVDVYDNAQLLEYYVGILDTLQPLSDLEVVVHFHIIQPRCYHREGPITTWTAAAHTLRALVNQLSMAEHEAAKPNAPTRAGPECHHCKARYKCEAHARATSQALSMGGTSQPLNYTPGALGVELRNVRYALRVLKARDEALTALAETLPDVPGFVRERGQTRRKWTLDDATIINMGQIMGKELAKPPAPITPTQALRIGVDATVISAYSKTVDGKVTLQIDNGSKAKRIFNHHG